MKQSEAKQMLPVIQAWGDGKAIQHKDAVGWVSVDANDDLGFNLPANNYRIKPEPKLRAWKPEEVPVGAIVRPICDSGHRWLISCVCPQLPASKSMVYFGHPCNDTFTSEKLLSSYTHSIDGGKTWLPCGVMEEVQ